MKILYVTLLPFLTLLAVSKVPMDKTNDKAIQTEITMKQDSVLRHVVLFKFKAGTSPEKINEIEAAFAALPAKIPEIASYEWGLNNSPEGLNKGLTHAFLLTFKSEADRAIYLPHPDHKAFGELLSPHLEDVTVVDYWSRDK
ncbi:Dabb family protein [Ulvibacterium sp.]|uniref:Dabb family protein n=1 Tax=Ulvibacterium sp. TaxID=2665914 RepID=UPI003BAAA1F6